MRGGTTVQGLSILKPPYSTISAISLSKGEIVWQIPHGETPDAIRNHPALKGMNIPRTGQGGFNIGTLVTKTMVVAGDGQVTSIDHPRGAMLRAYDKTNGKELGAVWMPAPQTGSPMTYSVNGKQYIVVAVSGGNVLRRIPRLRAARRSAADERSATVTTDEIDPRRSSLW